MKTVSVGLKNDFAAEDVSLAICIRVVRADGSQLGFTTWSESFEYEFLTNPDSHGILLYEPHEAFTPSNVSSSSDYGVDNLQIEGVLSSSRIKAEDLLAGDYEGAEVTIFRLNPENLSNGEMIDKFGTVGEVTISFGTYVAEFLSLASNLRRNVGNVTTPTCSVRRFCDNQCKLSVASYTHTVTIVSCSPRDLQFTISSATALTVARYGSGLIRYNKSGKWIEREIKSLTSIGGSNYTVTLRECLGVDLSSVSAELVEGCDRTLSTCSSLGNAVNFRGFPHLPGTDAITLIARSPS